MNCSQLRNGGLLVLVLFMTVLAKGQPSIKFKLQLLEPNKWGVYAKPVDTSPSAQTIPGSGQVTLVAPIGYYSNSNSLGLTSISGTWNSNAFVDGPIENPTKQYISVGLLADYPEINFSAGQETLLFTFVANENLPCPDSLYLIANDDPFHPLYPDSTPGYNSFNSNPGNEITIFDAVTPNVYEYAGNYAPSAWSCHDNDGDGILNAHEDTNGNGVYDNQSDASNLNSDFGLKYKLKLMPDNKRWGVYLKPEGINPSNHIIPGTAQVTVVAPNGYYSNSNSLGLTSISGTWYANSAVNGPIENPTKHYISVGMIADYPELTFSVGHETLLFTFMANENLPCPDSLYLFSNNDPFSAYYPDSTPNINSAGSNPGNEITVFDSVTADVYQYAGNYAPSAWSCHDNDGDGILNAHEDTNGNGVYDVGIDSSDLNSACTVLATITSHPLSQTVCSGFDESYFTAKAQLLSGADTILSEYHWQISTDGGASWSNLSNTSGIYQGVAGANLGMVMEDTLTISNSTGLDGFMYRICYTTPSCSALVCSDAATLNVQGPLTFTEQPENMIQCTYEPVQFCASVQNLSNQVGNLPQVNYRWQGNPGTGWVDLADDTIYNGVLTNCLSIASTYNMEGNQFRQKAWLNGCDTIYSLYALLDLEGPMTVTDEPDNVSECAGSGVTFHAAVALANGDPNTLMYQWEVIPWIPTNPLLPAGPGAYGTWTDVSNTTPYSGANTTTLAISDVAGLYKYRYRMRYRTPYCTPRWTNYAEVTVHGPITITNHPDHKTVCSGNSTYFSVQASNVGQGAVTYRWQVNMIGDTASLGSEAFWVNLQNSTLQNGVTSSTLSISNVAGRNGFLYRCLIQTTECVTVASYAALLRVEGPVSITTQPSDQTTCQDGEATFTASASDLNGADLLYQWQVSDTGNNFTDLQDGGPNEVDGATTPTLFIGNGAGLNGKRFRLAVKTEICNYIFSQPATLNLQDCAPKCLKAKLAVQSDSTSWAVVAKPSSNFDPTENAMTTAGRFIVVAPSDFNFIGLDNLAGEWTVIEVTEDVAGHPGKKFYTFELITTPGGSGVHIPYSTHHDTPLFRFYNFGPCPQFLYLLEEPVPNLPQNLLGGTDLVDNLAPVDFEFCSVYARKAWRCQKPGGTIPGGPIIVVTADDLGKGTPQEVVDRDGSLAEGNSSPEPAWFIAAPNPAGDYVDITISPSLAEGQSKLFLFDLQGKKWQEARVNQQVTRMDLAAIPAGVYFVALAQNGRVVHREKVVKN